MHRPHRSGPADPRGDRASGDHRRRRAPGVAQARGRPPAGRGGTDLGPRARCRADRDPGRRRQSRGAGLLACARLRPPDGRAPQAPVVFRAVPSPRARPDNKDQKKAASHVPTSAATETDPDRAGPERPAREGRPRGARDALGARPPALLPQGHPLAVGRGEGEGEPLQRDDRDRHRGQGPMALPSVARAARRIRAGRRRRLRAAGRAAGPARALAREAARREPVAARQAVRHADRDQRDHPRPRGRGRAVRRSRRRHAACPTSSGATTG